jgi:hypothetical protein
MSDKNLDANAHADLLPGWFITRMMEDTWSFGLLMSTGITICIQNINRVYQAADETVWIDVTLMDGGNDIWTERLDKPFVAPTSRLEASINTQHVLAAFEIADT